MWMRLEELICVPWACCAWLEKLWDYKNIHFYLKLSKESYCTRMIVGKTLYNTCVAWKWVVLESEKDIIHVKITLVALLFLHLVPFAENCRLKLARGGLALFSSFMSHPPLEAMNWVSFIRKTICHKKTVLQHSAERIQVPKELKYDQRTLSNWYNHWKVVWYKCVLGQS